MEDCCWQGNYWIKGSYWLNRSHHFESFTTTTMTWLTVMKYVFHTWPRICFTCRNTSRSFPHSWLITGFVTRVTRRMPLVEHELLTLPDHLSSPTPFSGVRVTWSIVLCACRSLSFCTFSFGHCVVCYFSIYGFWLPLCYLQLLLTSLASAFLATTFDKVFYNHFQYLAHRQNI